MLKRLIPLLALALCLAFPALAEDVRTVDAAAASTVECPESYLRVTCTLAEEGQVTVTVTDAAGGLYHQRDYGLCSGSFRSEDVYLRLDGAQTTYTVTVQAGATAYVFTVKRVMPRLTGVSACSAGYSLSRLTGSGSGRTATLLNISSLEGSSLSVPLIASGEYKLGTVTFSVSGGSLTVSASIDGGIDGTIDSGKVYVATDAAAAKTLGTRSFGGSTAGLNERVSLGGSSYAAVFVKLTVSFDPTNVPSGSSSVSGQEDLWVLMQNASDDEANG